MVFCLFFLDYINFTVLLTVIWNIGGYCIGQQGLTTPSKIILLSGEATEFMLPYPK